MNGRGSPPGTADRGDVNLMQKYGLAVLSYLVTHNLFKVVTPTRGKKLTGLHVSYQPVGLLVLCTVSTSRTVGSCLCCCFLPHRLRGLANNEEVTRAIWQPHSRI